MGAGPFWLSLRGLVVGERDGPVLHLNPIDRNETRAFDPVELLRRARWDGDGVVGGIDARVGTFDERAFGIAGDEQLSGEIGAGGADDAPNPLESSEDSDAEKTGWLVEGSVWDQLPAGITTDVEAALVEHRSGDGGSGRAETIKAFGGVDEAGEFPGESILEEEAAA